MNNKSEVSQWNFSRLLKNKNDNFSKVEILKILTNEEMDEAFNIISKWDNYFPTPILNLSFSNLDKYFCSSALLRAFK